jgi:cyclase
MLKKRIIFTLLYDSGYFMLSRNFRLQKVGNMDWLQRNYNFSHIAFYIDELIVLDVSRKERGLSQFCHDIKKLTEGCFVPIAAGGGVRSVDDARQLLRSGADKIVINSAIFESRELICDLAKEFGQQCIVGSIDIKNTPDVGFRIFTSNGAKRIESDPQVAFAELPEQAIGELYLNSMDQDGTGQGYDFKLLDLLPAEWAMPIILAGGVGNSAHFIDGLSDPRVDAVATANLLNFVGDGLKNAREAILNQGFNLASWPPLAEFKSRVDKCDN